MEPSVTVARGFSERHPGHHGPAYSSKLQEEKKGATRVAASTFTTLALLQSGPRYLKNKLLPPRRRLSVTKDWRCGNCLRSASGGRPGPWVRCPVRCTALLGAMGSRGPVASGTALLDLPPQLLGRLCALLDGAQDPRACTRFAERLSSNWLEVRHFEKYVQQGRSGTRELLWSWAQKNKTVGDLLQVLEDMGHQRAIDCLTNPGESLNISPSQTCQRDGFQSRASKETAGSVVGNEVLSPPKYQHQGIRPKASIDFKNIIEGTGNFHGDLLIGEGGFFQVYKMEFENQTYAVKLLKQEKTMQSKKYWKPFFSEMEVLLLFRHPNILELTAYFIEAERFCLVYPFMRHGSLFDRLQCLGNTAPLSWKVRLGVLIGIAQAIRVLHSAKPCSVISGSVTSTNILLDDQFQPKLTDFATVHLQPQTDCHSLTISTKSNMAKRFWYMPEEYLRQSKLSTKTDVYSFGIVIMEVLTGCKVVMEEPKHIQLRDLLLEMMEKRGLDSCFALLDKKVEACPRNFSAKLFTLAGRCATSRAKSRPSMDEVLETLESSCLALYFTEDPPASLRSFRPPSPLFLDLLPNVPVEDDENLPLSGEEPNRRGAVRKTPFECSQSEVTFLGCVQRVATDDASHVAGGSGEGGGAFKSDAHLWPFTAGCVETGSPAEAAGFPHGIRLGDGHHPSVASRGDPEEDTKGGLGVIRPEEKEKGKYSQTAGLQTVLLEPGNSCL
ncbi:interleukin-1 receptor-associated kinase 3 [Tachyglossus aculeatus]|uniref:interleukin-1 receptor-associated kinase 3 n=1 Tax=Tachyglossus aculeatus TaxID=9261 RepID=UPI0018F474B6|nr:interleukin-1 receptor-associated kinase 3 [Tachyglossus aculeatus]